MSAGLTASIPAAKQAEAFANSAWWWAQDLEPRPDQYVDFGCDFTLPETAIADDFAAAVEEAWIALTCGTWFTLWLNGRWLHHGPLREVAPWQYFDRLDLRAHLRPGRNRLRVRAYHAGISNQSHAACMAGLLFDGRVCAKGLDLSLAHAGHWRAAPSAGFLAGAPRLHPCQFFGEHLDLATDPETWLRGDLPAHWKTPAVVAAHPLPERPQLLPRDLPPFAGETFRAHPVGEVDSWQVWAFEGIVFGFLSLDLESPRSLTCEVLHGESLTRAGLPDHRFSGGDFREILEMPAGRRRWESFDKRALRYLALPSGVRVRSASLREYHYPLRETWRTDPKAKDLPARDHALLAAAARSIRLNCDDLLTDCPRRERAQYHDPAIYLEAFPRLFGTVEPLRRWFRQYLRGADADGVPRMCYPSPAAAGRIPDFALALPDTVARLHALTGDRILLREGFAAAHAATRAFEEHADSSGLLTDVPGWIFLCNSFELARHPRSAALNALWSFAWKRLAELAALLGDSRAPAFAQRAREIRAAWRACFLRDGRILDADSSPAHEARLWWGYHHDFASGHFPEDTGRAEPFTLRFEWTRPPRRLLLAAPGPVRLTSGDQTLFDHTPEDPWRRNPVFHPVEIDLPPETAGPWALEVAPNSIDREFMLAAAEGEPLGGSVRVCTADHPSAPAELRPWMAPRHNQITTGYAAATGMLDPEEATRLLDLCLPADYPVAWMRKSTPVFCQPTTDRARLARRVVPCNTPHALAWFCRALAAHQRQAEAADLCRRFFEPMIASGDGTLWEEFAPRSSRAHAWGAMLAIHL
ncbi:MAG: hypothetical protein JJT96_15975 [Opitutales bacterium]|nr:hypothetical protein [Opitutales bacterium]